MAFSAYFPLCFFALLSFLACDSKPSAQLAKASLQASAPNSPSNTLPLLVVVGFDREEEQISLNELGKAYCAGEVYVMAHLQATLAKMFQCQGGKVLASLKDFVPLAKKHLLITDLRHLSPQFRAIPVEGVSFFDNPKQYPLYQQGSDGQAFDFEGQITKFTLTGVTAMTRRLGPVLNQKGTKWLTEKVIHEFKKSDWVHISNEVSFKAGCGFNTGRQFCSLEAHFQALKDLGTNIVELTGNHNLDHGKEPYLRTFEWYKKNNMQTFGGGTTPEEAQKALLVPLKDGKLVAFVGYNELCPLGECYTQQYKMGANPYDSLKARKQIQALRQNPQVSYIIVGVQFGEVDSYAPTKSQARISRYLLDCGADMVYGSQAHQVQQIEFYKGKPLLHGLGNFLFDQTHRVGVRQAYFMHHYFFEGKIVQSVPVFTFESEEIRPEIATAEQAAAMKKVVYVDALLYGKW